MSAAALGPRTPFFNPSFALLLQLERGVVARHSVAVVLFQVIAEETHAYQLTLSAHWIDRCRSGKRKGRSTQVNRAARDRNRDRKA